MSGPNRRFKGWMTGSRQVKVVVALIAGIWGQTFESPVVGEEILPRSFPASRYRDIWNNSPFLRLVGDSTSFEGEAPVTLEMSLEGLVIDEHLGPIGYLQDKKTGAFLIVTENPSPSHPFLITATRPNRDPSLTVVSISDGDRTAEIRFSGATGALANGGAETGTDSNRNAGLIGTGGSLPMAETFRENQASPPKTAVSGPPGKRFRIPVPDLSESEKVRGIKNKPSTRSEADSAESLTR